MLVTQTSAVPSGIVATVGHFTDFLLGYAAALGTVGALAMALIEAAKKVWDSRTKFHARRITSWVAQTTPDPTAALSELLQLCTGASASDAVARARELVARKGRLNALHAMSPDPAHAVFALELEKMMAAIQEAGDVALTTPSRYPSLYQFVTNGASRDDVEQWAAHGEGGMAEIANTQPTPATRRQVKEMADRFTRLRQVMKR